MQGLTISALTVRPVGSARVLATLTLLSLFAIGHAAPQAVKILRPHPRPQDFSFSSLTVSASPASVSFALVNGAAATGSTSVTVTTSYSSGQTLSGTLTLYAFFASSTNALTGGSPSNSIPSSDVFGQVLTGTPNTYTAFTQATPFSGASGLQLYSVSSVSSATGSRTDNLSLKIDLGATPQLPAAIYTGTITLQAQSF